MYKKITPIFFIFLTACGYSIYNPIDESSTSVSKKGDLKLNAGFIQLASSAPRVGIGYSPINHIGVNYNGIFNELLTSNSIALGFYQNLHREKNTSAGKNKTMPKRLNYFDFYAGISHVNSKYFEINFADFPAKILDANMIKYHFQLAHHYSKNKICFDLGMRLAFLDFYKIDYSNLDFPLVIIYSNDPFTQYELSGSLNFGDENFNLNLGSNYRHDVFYPKFPNSYEHLYKFSTLNIFMGTKVNLNYVINSIKKKGRKK